MSDDWYKRDVRAAIKGMGNLTPEERGCYNSLIDHQYLMGGPLHDDDRYLAGLMNCDVRVWRRVKQQLLDKQRIALTSDGRIEDLRASYELAARDVQRSKRAASGKLGGIASGKSRKANTLAEANASSKTNQIREDKIREDKNNSIEGTNAPTPKRASQIPSDWYPSAKNLQGLRAKGFLEPELGEQLERFRDFHRSKGNTFKDFDAAFRTWMAKSRDFAKGRGPPKSRTQQAFDRLDERFSGNGRDSGPGIREGGGEISLSELSAAGSRSRNIRGYLDSPVHREAEDIASEDGESR